MEVKVLASEWEWSAIRTGTRGHYVMAERRWIVEYVIRKCSDAVYRVTHKRLGPTPPELATRYPTLPHAALRVALPYVDAVCVFDDRIEIIEVKVHDPVKAIAQLQRYRILAEQDPELRQFLPRPIIPKLVYWRRDPEIEAMCKANGIVLDVELPEWLVPYLRRYGYKLD